MEKLRKAIDRGYNLPNVLKGLGTEELKATRVAIDRELQARGAKPLEHRVPARTFTPKTA